MKKIAINGFGRIGRAFLRQTIGNPHFEIVAINDLGSIESLAYLLKYDTVYGKANFSILPNGEDQLLVDGKTITVLHQKDPANLPWGDMAIDLVLECTGLFTAYDKANAHILAGAQHVVISAPAKKGGAKKR